MFRRLTEPLPLSAASLLLLRPALNAPVLNVGYLPVGPARAVVVAFGEEYGGIGIALGVRSTEGGQLVVLRNQESIDFDVPLADALEPLLAEAERMGFLFDEDVFEANPGAPGRAQAMALWAELMGGMESLIPARTPTADARSAEDDGPVGPLSPSLAVDEMQYSELMLDDVAPLVLDGDELGFADEGDDTLESDFGDEFEDVLDDELDEELEGAPEAWSLDASVVGEADLTEPTAPILPLRATAAPAPLPVAPAPIEAAQTPKPTRSVPGPLKAPVEPRETGAVEERVTPKGRVAPKEPIASREPVAPDPIAKKPSAPMPAPGPAALSAPAAVTLKAGEGAPSEPIASPAELPKSAVAPTSPRVVLSKFRQVDGRAAVARTSAPKGEVGSDRSSELARIPIVRVRREREGNKRVPFLARLLSSF